MEKLESGGLTKDHILVDLCQEISPCPLEGFRKVWYVLGNTMIFLQCFRLLALFPLVGLDWKSRLRSNTRCQIASALVLSNFSTVSCLH
jgi:hypothetical protein